MLGHRALLDGANGELMELVESPFRWRGAERPVAEAGKVEVGHYDGSSFVSNKCCVARRRPRELQGNAAAEEARDMAVRAEQISHTGVMLERNPKW